MISTVTAQEKSEISLNQAIEKARVNNRGLRLSQKEMDVARAQYESSRAVLLPQLRVTNTSTFTNNPLHAFGFKLLQKDVEAADFDPDLLNDPGNVENFNTRLELIQPLINIDGWKERKSANLQFEISQLQSERTNEYVELEVTKTFMQLQLAYKMVKVYEKANETASENQKWAKSYLEEGLMQNADYLLIKVHQSDIENKLFRAKTQVKDVSEYLSFLIGDENDQVLVPTGELELHVNDANPTISLNDNRKDLLALELSVQAQENMLGSSKMKFVPRANAVANYEWNDDRFMGFGADNYLVGIQLSWDLFSGYKNIGKIHKEKALLEKASLEQEKYKAESEIELNKAKRKFEDSKNLLVLSNLALEQSKEALRITSNRFKQGLEKSKDLLLAETLFQEKELEYHRSVFDHNFTLAYLKFLTR